MKKIYYESPTVEVVDVRVEAGFQNSPTATTTAESYDLWEGEMTPTDSY